MNRLVQFNSSVNVIDIPDYSCSQYDDDNDVNVSNEKLKSSIWYTSDEMLLIRMSASDDIQEKEKLQTYCIDADEYAGNKIERKQDAISYVLQQQELLWDDDVEDPDVIAEVYMEETRISQIEATQRATRHAEHVLEILRGDDDESGDIYTDNNCNNNIKNENDYATDTEKDDDTSIVISSTLPTENTVETSTSPSISSSRNAMDNVSTTIQPKATTQIATSLVAPQQETKSIETFLFLQSYHAGFLLGGDCQFVIEATTNQMNAINAF